jgi:hypothetical protein
MRLKLERSGASKNFVVSFAIYRQTRFCEVFRNSWKRFEITWVPRSLVGWPVPLYQLSLADSLPEPACWRPWTNFTLIPWLALEFASSTSLVIMLMCAIAVNSCSTNSPFLSSGYTVSRGKRSPQDHNRGTCLLSQYNLTGGRIPSVS